MKKEEFYFDSRDGQSKVYAVRYTPDSDEVVGVVQIVHGMAEYVERYEEFARFFTDKGFVVTGNDHLGHGKSVPQGGTYGYFCEQDPATVVVRDVHRLKKLTQKVYPGVPYIILGHSMGSYVLRNYMCRYGTGISGAIVMGTGMEPVWLLKFSEAFAKLQKRIYGSKHVSKIIHKLMFTSHNKRITHARTSVDWLCRNEACVDRYVADSLCGFVFTVNGFLTVFELIARLQNRENLDKMPGTLPVLMLSGAEDPVGDYGKGVEEAYKSLSEAGLEKIDMKLYEKDRHELLNEMDRDVVMQDVYDWIRGTILV